MKGTTMSEKKESTAVINEGPESHTRLMMYDESFNMVHTWRPVGSIEGDSLGWRFITTEGRTVAVRPVQLPSNARPFCVPAEINSSMRFASWLILFAHGRVSVKGEPKEPDYPPQMAEEARKAAQTEYMETRKRFIREIALFEINAFIGRTTGKKPVPVREPGKRGGYSAKEQAVIVKRLTDPKDQGAAKLEAIRTFILHELFKDFGAEIMEAQNDAAAPAERKTYPPPGGLARAIIRDADLRRLVRFIGEKIGRKDMPLRVLLAYNSAMPQMFKGWIAEVAKVRKIKPAEAERFLAERVTFIAECEGRRFRHCYPIEDMTAEADTADKEDRAPYQVPVRHESDTITPPVVAHGHYESKGKRGRPIETDRKQDEAMLKQWESQRAAGTAHTHALFAEAIEKPLREVKPALERARKRRERDRLARQK